MPEHHQQRTMKVFHRVLHASQCDGVSDISRRAHHKKVAEALVEDQFRTNPAVRTSEDDCFGRLSRSKFLSKGNQRSRLRLTSHEPAIAGHKTAPHLIR